MLKVHIYTNGNESRPSSTLHGETLGLTFVRQSSVRDKGGFKRNKGPQIAMISVVERDGELFILNAVSGERIKTLI